MEKLSNETNANYVYMMKNFDRLGRDIGVLATDKKIGKSVNPPQREKQLNPTKHPLGIALYKLFRTDNFTHQHEKGLQVLLRNANIDGEWFSDEDDTLTGRVTKYFEIWGCPEIELGTDEDPGVNRIRREQKSKDEWKKFFEVKREEHPDWFVESDSSNYAYYNKFTKYVVQITGQRNGTFTTEVRPHSRQGTDFAMRDEDIVSSLKELFGDDWQEGNKKLVYRKHNTFDEAFELYKKLVTAGKNGDINLNNETTEEE
jgi:hypothetical protein